MIYPLPAVLVGCGDASGLRNLLTVAWTGTVCTDPPMCCVSIRRERHSYDIIRRTGEFVINLTTEGWRAPPTGAACARAATATSFRRNGPHAGPRGAVVAAPTVEEAPISIECRVRQVLPSGRTTCSWPRWSMCRPTNATSTPADASTSSAPGPWSTPHGEYFGLGGAIGRFGWSVRKKPQARAGSAWWKPARAAASEQRPRCRSANLRCPDCPDCADCGAEAGPGRGAEKSGRPRCEEFETPIILWNMLYDTLHTFVFSLHGHRAPHGRRHRPGFRRCEPLRLRPRALRGVARHPAA